MFTLHVAQLAEWMKCGNVAAVVDAVASHLQLQEARVELRAMVRIAWLLGSSDHNATCAHPWGNNDIQFVMLDEICF